MTWLRYIGTVLLVWAGSTLLAEGVFRAIGDRPTFDLEGLYESFDNGNYKLRPDADTEAHWASGYLSVHTDGLGLRTDAARHLAANPGDTLDILLIGDSQGFGNGVSFEESLAGSLAIRAAEDGFRVGNASVGGHTMASQLRLAQLLGERYRLAVKNYVILLTPVMIHGCDKPNAAMVGDDGRLYEDAVSFQVRARLWIKTHVVLYARVRDALRNSGIGVEPTVQTPELFQLYAAGETESKAREDFLPCARRFKEFAAHAGAQLRFVYVPSTVEADFEPIRRAAETRGLSIERDTPLRVYTAVSQQLGIPLHNLRPTLESLRAQKDALHLRGDFHYNRTLSIACGTQLWRELEPSIKKAQSRIVNKQD